MKSTPRRGRWSPPEIPLTGPLSGHARASSVRSMLFRPQPRRSRATLVPTLVPYTPHTPHALPTSPNHFTATASAPRTQATTPARTSARRSPVSGAWPPRPRTGTGPAPQTCTARSRSRLRRWPRPAPPCRPQSEVAPALSSQAPASRQAPPSPAKAPSPRVRLERQSPARGKGPGPSAAASAAAVSYTHLRAHETRHDLVCRLLLEKKKKTNTKTNKATHV